ncbi:MAG: BT_3928 family protein [Cytophagales bacterium]
MKFITQFCRIFVGVLFVISGLIKLNDPVGTAIKMEEYFEVFAESLAFFKIFVPFSTAISVIFCVAEVVLGIAVLLQYRMKITMWGMMLLILFFSFLTFYSAYFEKVTDCGCFGDAIKLEPWHSFWKDIILLVMILPLFLQMNRLKSVFSKKTGDYVMLGFTFLCFFMAYWVMNHLSFIDFRAYKVGASIPENMKLPPNAKPDIFEIKYSMKNLVSGDEKTITDKEYMESKIWEDTTWQITSTAPPKLIQKGDKPKITDYRIFNTEGDDFTQESFEGEKIIILLEHADKASPKPSKKIATLITSAQEKKMTVWVVTGSDYKTYEPFRHEWQWSAPFFNADPKVIKTIIRSNPGIMLLKDGVVKAKWHHNDTPELKEIEKKLKG